MLAAVRLLDALRPGALIRGRLGETPLAELLVGLLERSASGRLTVALHPEPRNHIEVRSGVPVQVSLPDMGPSLISLLVDEQLIPAERRFELVRLAHSTGASESEVLDAEKLIGPGRLREARERRAQAQLVRLMDVRDVDFVFEEGSGALDPAASTILQPLPLLFRGFVSSEGGRAAEPHLPRRSRSRLAPAYPVGLDPFGFGERLERALVEDASEMGLLRAGIGRVEARSALAVLELAKMIVPWAEIELSEPLSEPKLRPRAPSVQGRAPSTDGGVRRLPSNAIQPSSPRRLPSGAFQPIAPEPSPSLEPAPERPLGPRPARTSRSAGGTPTIEPARPEGSSSSGSPAADGLVIHRLSESRKDPSGPVELQEEPRPVVMRSSPRVPREEPDTERIPRTLGPFEEQGYFQILRVGPDTDDAQIERAYRFLVRRAKEEMPEALEVQDLLREAYAFLRDEERRTRYAAASASSRRALEIEMRFDRALRVLGEGRGEEAEYLLQWLCRLAPRRAELGTAHAAIRWLSSPFEERGPSPRSAVAIEARRTGDVRFRVLLVAVLAEEGAHDTARSIRGGLAPHPLLERFAGGTA